jgi:hypothetical protein
VSIVGGTGGTPGWNDGGSGRFRFETGDASTFAGAVIGPIATETAVFQPTDANPFLVGNPQTPTMPFISGGPDVYGVAVGYDQATLDAMFASKPDWAAVAMVLVNSPTDVGLSWDVAGYDLLLVCNVRSCAVRAPRLGIGVTVADQTLLERGPARKAEFGGGGATILGAIASGQVYATMVPEGQQHFAFTALHRTTWMSMYESALTYGTPVYLEQPDSIPDGTVFATLDIPMRAPRVDSVQATIPTVSGEAALDLRLGFDDKGRIIADGPATLDGAPVAVSGGIVFKKGLPYFDVWAKCQTDKSKCRITGPAGTAGAASSKAWHWTAKGKRKVADVSAQIAASTVTGNVLLYPQVDAKGKVTGTGELVSGFGNDPGVTGVLTGRIHGKAYTFTVKAGRQKLTYAGKLNGASFIGSLTVNVPPEKRTIRNFAVPDPRQFH